MCRLVRILAVVAVCFACSASGEETPASAGKPSSAVTQPDNSPAPSNVSPPRGRQGGSGQGGSAGQTPPSTGGTAPTAGTGPIAGGMSASGGAGAGGMLGASAGSSYAGGSGGSIPPAQGGNGATTGGGQESVGSQPECPSETRAKLANGTCVDRFREFSVGTRPMSIAVDAGGTIWFIDDGSDELIAMDANGNVSERLKLRTHGTERRLLAGAASDETFLWLSDSAENSLTQFRISGETKVTYIGEDISGLALGANDSIWVADLNVAVHELTRTGDPVMTRPAAPSASITVDGDGNVWWPEAGQYALVRLTLDGETQPFEVSDGNPTDLCWGPDGAIWYVDNYHHQVGRRTPSASGRTFDLPINSSPESIVAGKDQAVWFTERAANAIGRISVKGTNAMTHYRIPTPASESYGIAVAPDGTLWFSESNSGKIGRLIPDALD